jgi:4-amino-4-deoxy-L-arabinose transferase-like glycosyltransferase
MSAEPERVRRLFLLMIGILVVYGLIVGLADHALVAGGRIAVLALVLIGALGGRRRSGRLRAAGVVASVVAVAVVVIAALAGSDQLFDLVTSIEQTALVAAAMIALGESLWDRRAPDIATVLGVLCIYLLLALFFASLHQIGAAVTPGYLAGVEGPDTPGDCLYLSVITLTTVGFGDVTPATQYGRTVAIMEAMVGQLYLVSVVAAVGGGWRARPQPPPSAGQEH